MEHNKGLQHGYDGKMKIGRRKFIALSLVAGGLVAAPNAAIAAFNPVSPPVTGWGFHRYTGEYIQIVIGKTRWYGKSTVVF